MEPLYNKLYFPPGEIRSWVKWSLGGNQNNRKFQAVSPKSGHSQEVGAYERFQVCDLAEKILVFCKSGH